jgi:ankyrin repeat protein
VELLLHQEGVEKEARDEDGNSPLHVAAENQQTLTVQLLLDTGCPTDPENAVILYNIFQSADFNFLTI